MAKEYVKNYPKEIAEIDEHLKAIAKVVDSLPAEASFTKSLVTSVVNFQKKVDGFLVVSSTLTEQQKKAIAAIKAGKPAEEVSKILTTSENPAESSTEGNDEQSSASPKVKGKKSRN